MPRGRSVQIGEIEFSSKGAALAYLRSVLYKYNLEERISSVDAAFLLDALTEHPEAKVKIGVGLESFFVRRADFGTRCFWIRRLDGSEERFSFKSCVR